MDRRPDNKQAPPNSLPDWDDCALLIANSEFRKSDDAERLEGPISPEPTELHRFIYEYDDADPYGSAWFLHRLEMVLNEVKASAAELANEHTAALIAENARLRADAERYRWLTKYAYIGGCFTDDGVVLEVQNVSRKVPISGPVDVAIDAARAALAEHKAARQFYESCEAEARAVMRNRSEK